MAYLNQNGGPANSAGFGVETRGDRLLDLAHLSRQCMGDEDFEAEILSQFRTQSLALAAQLAADSLLPFAAQADIAHRLRGSALAVGAPAVASCAEVVEACGRADGFGSTSPDVEMSRAISTLSDAVSRTVAEIDRLRG
jgi:HPt (histidine-containing phosphotransfer) domain-containing protein